MSTRADPPVLPVNSWRQRSAPPMLYAVYFVYFFCGLTQCFEGVFLPEFKAWFNLSYEQQMYALLAKNLPFLLASLIGFALHRISHKSSLVLALILFGSGTLLLVPGLRTRQYAVVLVGFFIIGLGFNFQIVAGNPLLSALGSTATASSRLNLGNALGAIAQVIAPASLSFLIPAAMIGIMSRIAWVQKLLAVLAGTLFCTAFVIILMRHSWPLASMGGAESKSTESRLPPRLYLGLAAIFLSLGAEAALFGFFRNYLEDPTIAGLTATQSERLFTLYFALFAAGRLVAAWAQTKVRPALYLAVNVVAAMLFALLAIFAKASAAVVIVTCIGFWVSTFYPTLYSLAMEGTEHCTGQASGLLTMGFLGAALFPVMQGKLADNIGLQQSYWAIVVVYALLACYCGWYLSKQVYKKAAPPR